MREADALERRAAVLDQVALMLDVDQRANRVMIW
jgi:hypothetical protein